MLSDLNIFYLFKLRPFSKFLLKIDFKESIHTRSLVYRLESLNGLKLYIAWHKFKKIEVERYVTTNGLNTTAALNLIQEDLEKEFFFQKKNLKLNIS